MDIILIDCEYMKHLINYLVSRDSFSGNFYSFVILNFRSFCGLMMLPYGYGKIVNYDRYAADFFGDPIGIGDIPSLWLTIFAQTICPIMLLVGFQTRLAASVLAFNMMIRSSFTSSTHSILGITCSIFRLIPYPAPNSSWIRYKPKNRAGNT